MKEFNKLIQEDTVIKYQEKFKEMRSQLLTERYYISSFIGGLREEFSPVVRMHNPLTLNHVIELVT